MNIEKTSMVHSWLKQSSPSVLVIYTCIAAFSAYCCMYAMRKPFTAAAYSGLEWQGTQFKIVLVVSQVLGYALSKFIGIRVISSMRPQHRAVWLIALLGTALLALLGFAVTPFPYNALWLFVNGLPLGMIWGLVFSYLEGRRSTELLTAAISINFIISSGFVKSVGKWLLDVQGVSEFWMPFVTGLIFVPPLFLSVVALSLIKQPSAADKALRSERLPMTSTQRRELWIRYAPGFVLLIGAYLVLTILRDLRDNFAVEIWTELGYGSQPAILTTAELPVAAITLLGLGILMVVKENFKALQINHLLTIACGLLLAACTFLFQQQRISPVLWMISTGVALFIPYIIFNGILFDRILAAFKESGNVGFLMYVADAIGYLGSVVILLWRNFGFSSMSWLEFYQDLCYLGAILLLGMMLFSLKYFQRKANEPLRDSMLQNQPIPTT